MAPGPTRTDIAPLDGDDRGDWLLELLSEGATAGRGVSGRVLNWLSGGRIDRHARTPMERLGEPEEIAGTIAFLAYQRAVAAGAGHPTASYPPIPKTSRGFSSTTVRIASTPIP